MCDVGNGNGLVYMFQRKWPSYRKLTLKFLSFVKVTKDRRYRVPQSIDFRLGNYWHSLTMEELSGVFHCFDPNPEEDNEYDYSEVWGPMTTEEEHASGYAKSSSIRNPVLRYLHRAMTQLMFTRSMVEVSPKRRSMLYGVSSTRTDSTMKPFSLSMWIGSRRKTEESFVVGD